MARVYVVQLNKRRNRATGVIEPTFDISPAEEYGELIELLSPTAKPFTPQPVIEELYIKLDEFTADDYVLCIGNPILIGMACVVASDISGGEIKMLQWSGKQQKYIEVAASFVFNT